MKVKVKGKKVDYERNVLAGLARLILDAQRDIQDAYDIKAPVVDAVMNHYVIIHKELVKLQIARYVVHAGVTTDTSEGDRPVLKGFVVTKSRPEVSTRWHITNKGVLSSAEDPIED